MKTSELAEKVIEEFKLDSWNPEWVETVFTRMFGKNVYSEEQHYKDIMMHKGLAEIYVKQAEQREETARRLLHENRIGIRKEQYQLAEECIRNQVKGKYRLEGALHALGLIRAILNNDDKYT